MATSTDYPLGFYVIDILNIIYAFLLLLLILCKTTCNKRFVTERQIITPLSNTIYYLTISHISFYFIHCIAQFIYAPSESTLIQNACLYSARLCIVFEICSFYVLSLVRLQSTFNLTQFSPSKPTVYSYSVAIIILFFLWIGYSFMSSFVISEHLRETITRELGFSVIGLNIFIGLSFVYSFNSRLLGIISFYSKSYNGSIAVGNDMYNNEESHEIELNPRQHKLLNAAIKTALLSTITIVMLQLLVSVWILYNLQIIENEHHRYQLIVMSIRSLAVFVELFCVYLTFPFNPTLYMQLCGCSHNLCKYGCARMVAPNDIKAYESKQSDANYQFLL